MTAVPMDSPLERIVLGSLDLRHVEGENWELLAPLNVTWGDYEFQVKEGFLTDLASIPRVVRWLVPKGRNESKAAVVHDWLYRHDFCRMSRAEADALFLAIMEECGVGGIRRQVIYRAVRIAGGFSWGGIEVRDSDFPGNPFGPK